MRLKRNLLTYASVRSYIDNGDLLLWRPTNLCGRLIARYSEGRYSHVGSASWAGDVLESHDMLQWEGGRTRNLSAWVYHYPGVIDVYRLSGIDRYKMSQSQRRRAGEPYNWDDLAAIGLRLLTDDKLRMPWRKRLVDVSKDYQPELWERLYRTPLSDPAFCAEAVVSDVRRADLDLLPSYAAWEVSPNMLASVSEYRFTLTV